MDRVLDILTKFEGELLYTTKNATSGLSGFELCPLSLSFPQVKDDPK